MITAMDTLLITLTALAAAVAGVIAMVHFARQDTFAGPGIGHQQRDELGALVTRRRSS